MSFLATYSHNFIYPPYVYVCLSICHCLFMFVSRINQKRIYGLKTNVKDFDDNLDLDSGCNFSDPYKLITGFL